MEKQLKEVYAKRNRTATIIDKNGISITLHPDLVPQHWIVKTGGKGSGSIHCHARKTDAEADKEFFMGKTMYNGAVKYHTYSDGKTLATGVGKVRFGHRRKTDGYGYQGRFQASTSGYFPESAIGDTVLGFGVLVFLISVERPTFRNKQSMISNHLFGKSDW